MKTRIHTTLPIRACVVSGILLVTFLFLSPCLQAGFISMDDPGHLLSNPEVRSLDLQSVRRIFAQTINQTYIPLTTLSYALEYHFFKYNPFIYHLNNLFLHLAVTGLTFWLFLRLGAPLTAAGLGALIFGIHPMHVESVAWITERKDVLYSFFYLLALHSYWGYIHPGTGNTPGQARRKTLYLASLLFSLLSILSKPMALSLPLIFFLCDWFSRRPWRTALIYEKLPHAFIIAGVAWITFSLNARVPIGNVIRSGLIWAWTFAFYLKTFFWPMSLSIIHALPEPVALTHPAYLFSLLTFVFVLTAFLRFRGNRIFVFALLYYFFSIFFLLRFDDTVDITLVADRFMYLPSLGICFALGVAAQSLVSRFAEKKGRDKQVMSYLALIFLLLFLGIKSFLQCRLWQDELSLWNTSIQNSPNAYYALRNRGTLFMNQKKFGPALADYNRSLAIKPDFARSYFQRGILYGKMGQRDKSISDFTQAIRLEPDYTPSYNNRALAYMKQGEIAAALHDLNTYIAFEPDEVEARFNRAKIFLRQGSLDRAIADLTYFLKERPFVAKGYYLRGLCFMRKGDLGAAAQDFSVTLKMDPQHQGARKKLFLISTNPLKGKPARDN